MKQISKVLITQKKAYSFFRVVVSFSIITYLISLMDVVQMISAVKQATIYVLLMAVFITPLSMMLRIYKWKLVVNQQIHLSWLNIGYIFSVGLFISAITPAKIGDIIRVKYLAKHQIPIKIGVALSIIDRIYDLLAISFFALFSFTVSIKYSSLSLVAGFIILFLYLLSRKIIYTDISKFDFIKSFSIKQKEIISVFRSNYIQKRTVRFFLTSILIWLSLGLQTSIILKSFGYSVPIVVVTIIVSMGAIAGLIPVTFSGLGVREGLIALLLIQVGVGQEVALTTAFLYTIISFLFPAFISGIIYLIYDQRYDQFFI